jgi:hypothetical protein
VFPPPENSIAFYERERQKQVASHFQNLFSNFHHRLSSKTAFLIIIVVVTLVCVAGVLILPQVDLPNFTVSRSSISTVADRHSGDLSMSGLDVVSVSALSHIHDQFHRSGFPIVQDTSASLITAPSACLRC